MKPCVLLTLHVDMMAAGHRRDSDIEETKMVI